MPHAVPSSSTTSTSRASARPRSRPGRASTARCAATAPPSTCLTGGHAVWWRVQADDADAALALLPRFVAERTTAIEVSDIEIP